MARGILETLAFMLYVIGFVGLVVGFLLARAGAALLPRRAQPEEPAQASLRHAK